MIEKEKYFYLLSISDNQLPKEFEEFGVEQIVISSDGYNSDIEAIGSLNKTISNLNKTDISYKFNSSEYPVNGEDQFEDNSVIQLGDNFLKLLMLVIDKETVSNSSMIGKVFSLLSDEEYSTIKDNPYGEPQHVLH